MVLSAKMLLRSSSTPLLTSASGVPLMSNSQTPRDVERERESPRPPPRLNRSMSFSSIALASAASSPILQQQLGVIDDNRSVDGSEWDFSGDVVPWPRFKRVQSEGDLEGLRRGSALTAAAESLITSPRSKGKLERNFDEENFGTIGRHWSRRMVLRRQSSLSVIPSNSDGSCASESEDIHEEGFSLTNDLLEVVDPETEIPESQAVEDEAEKIPEYGFQYSGDEAVRGSDYLTQMGEYLLPNSFKGKFPSICDVDAGAPDGLESEFRLASEAAQGFSSRVASVSGRDGVAYHDASDGERYTTVATGPNGTILVCNSRGCKPVAKVDHLGAMFTAGGFGMGGVGGGGSGRSGSVGSGGGSGRGDSLGTDAYYKRALEADPGHPLLLRNYAKYLHEVKRDTSKAESYYERAILANPGDGELLGLYAKLIWDVYKDQERSESYFEQALQAAPDNCYVVAAYASFMWASDDVEEPEQQLHCSGRGAGLAPRYSSLTAS